MRLLLDENLPKRLKLDFTEHEIFTVSDKGWNGKKNENSSSFYSKKNLVRFSRLTGTWPTSRISRSTPFLYWSYMPQTIPIVP